MWRNVLTIAALATSDNAVMNTPAVRIAAAFVLSLFLTGPAAMADEGMWLFNAPPTKQLKEKYNFEPSVQWLDHLQKASVRFNSGGQRVVRVGWTGSCITNHHVGADALQKFSDAQHNYPARRLLRGKTQDGGKAVPRPGTQRPDEH